MRKAAPKTILTAEAAAYWSRPAGELMRELGTTAEGLNSEAARLRLAETGPNTLETRARAGPLALFLNQFKSPIVLILLFATIISTIVRDWPDAFIILVIILASAFLSFVQEHAAGRAAEKLKTRVSVRAKVLRDGSEQSVLTDEVVPGDVVLLAAGSLIPADGVLLEARDFFVNEAVLTGEAFPVEKTPGTAAPGASLGQRTNCVFMGTSVRSGSARALMVQTGPRAVFGQVARRLTLRPPETEFERGIRRLGGLLSEVMFVLVVGIFAVNALLHKHVLDSLLFSVALAVGLTPQLLPAIININLSKGSRAMAARGVIVRRLASIENFGSMDILCTDKTGTLTLGIANFDGALDPEGRPSVSVRRDAYLNSRLQTGLPNPLDEAVIRGGAEGADLFLKLDEIPYDFTRKRLSVVVRKDSTARLIAKGALEGVLSVCSRVRTGDGVSALDDARKTSIRERFEGWSGQGYRVLGLASKDVPLREGPYSVRDESDLAFDGFLLFMDPPKPGVKETIDRLKGLGVNLKIITGDNPRVARHAAQAIGLAEPRIMTGAELDSLRDEALWHAAERTDIFAEVDPNQKERILLALKKTGHVVGYLGDGINDAPALHSADVGISVDNATDVAKDAADLVLLEHDLAVLELGIREGRKTFANTLKYVFMAVSANFGNMSSMAGASLLLPFLPMLPKQILLINVLTDLPEMAIASDRVDEALIERPRRWDVGFIRRFMLVFGPLSSVFDFLTFGFLLWFLRADESLFRTGWFVESVLSAALVVFALRTKQPVWHSRPSRAVLWATGGVSAIVLALPYSPLAGLFNFKPLPPAFLLAILAIAGLYFISAEFVKRRFFRRHLS